MLKTQKSAGLWGLLLLCLSWLWPLQAYANVALNCPQLQALNAPELLSRATVSSVQQQLLSLGFNPDKIDGILGGHTAQAIAEYCRVDEVHHNWPTTVASGNFQQWLTQQQDPNALKHDLHSGKSWQVIAVLDKYQQRPSASLPKPIDDVQQSYLLSKKDWNALKGANGVYDKVAELMGQSFASQREFKKALQAALKNSAEADSYYELVTLDEQSNLVLTKQGLNDLKVLKLPAYILQPLNELQDLSYPDQQLYDAVNEILDKLNVRIRAFQPELVKLAEITPEGARFSDAGLKKFATAHANDLLAEAVLARLQLMKNVQYQSDKTVSKAVSNVLEQLVEETTASVGSIVDQSEQVLSYSPSQDSVALLSKALSNMALPEVYLTLLQDMLEQEFPHEDLFWQAVKVRVALAAKHDPYRVKIEAALNKLNSNKFDDALLAELNSQQLPPVLIAQIQDLSKRNFASSAVLHEAIFQRFQQLADDLAPFKALIVSQAKKTHSFTQSKSPIWTGKPGCHCVTPHLSGQVYGFYPYWLAGDQQLIDFSVYSRIAYYGLSFDDKGELPNLIEWKRRSGQFVEVAHRYGTKLDLVIQRQDWQSWQQLSVTEKMLAFEKLANNITEALEVPLEDVFSKSRPYLSLGFEPAATMADGVTLYFDGYPHDKDSLDAFNLFVRTLRDRLDGSDRVINLMFRSTELGRGIYQPHFLLDVLNAIRTPHSDLDGQILVLLQESTSADKKHLRAQIEAGLEGRDRMKLLRNVAMVLSYDGRSIGQLRDDIIYAEDSFGGIGIWPLSFASDAGLAEAEAIKANYVLEEEAPTAVAQKVCGVVCPNKAWFRLGLGLYILLIGASVVLYFRVCSCQHWIEKHFLAYIGLVLLPSAAIGFSLLVCDPLLAHVAKNNVPLFFLVLAIMIYLVWNAYNRKEKENLP